MGWRKKPNLHDRHRYQAIFSVGRAISDFEVELPDTIPKNVQELVDYIATKKGVSPTTPIDVRLDPSSDEVEEKASQMLREGLLLIGGTDPVSIDADISPNDLVPVEDRLTKWHQLSDTLHCKLPSFMANRWTSGLVFHSTYLLIAGVIVTSAIYFELEPGPPNVDGFAIGLIRVVAGLSLAAVVTVVLFWVAFRTSEVLCRQDRIPFDSVAEFVGYIEWKSDGLKESLRRTVTTTIQQHVTEIVAEFFRVKPDSVSGDFLIEPESRLNDTGLA